jgi:ribonuclease HI
VSSYITVFIDGACRNNGSKDQPSDAAAAVVIYRNRKEIARFVRGVGRVTNNIAEYEALISALLICSMMDFPRPVIYSDSLLVVNHTKGIWQCKSADLLPFYMTVKEIQAEFVFDIVHVPRKRVFIPDHLCNIFLDELEEKRKALKIPALPSETES